MNSEWEADHGEFTLKSSLRSPLSKSLKIRKNLSHAAKSMIYHELSLRTFFHNRSRFWKGRNPINEIMNLVVFSRILSPASKKRTYEEKDRFFEKMDFSQDDLYRSMSLIDTLKDPVQVHLNRKMKELYNRSSELVYYDVTNYYFEIDDQDEYSKKGFPRNTRRIQSFRWDTH